MRIIISINTSWNIYNFRSGLVKALQQQGHEVHAIAPKDDYSQLLEDELKVQYHPIMMDNKGSNPIKDLKLLTSYKKLFRRINPDVILQYTIKPNIYGTIAAKQLGIPVINNVSGLGTIFINPKSITSKIGRLLYKYAFKFPYKVFFQNEDDRNLFVENKLIQKKITDVLPGSGVNLASFPFSSKVKSDQFTFLMVARVLYDKGVVEYAEAAKSIREKHPNTEFQLLGFHDRSKGSIPQEEFDKWVKEGTINYLGTSDNVASIIESSDCVVLPSYREGTPKTLLEALAIGRPIVTTNVPGCKETVINEENGYLCKVKNAKDLASKLNIILTKSDEDLVKMGARSRMLAEAKFDEQIVINRYLAEINGI